MSDDYKIYVDGAQPATLNDGAGVLTDYPTLQQVGRRKRGRLSPDYLSQAQLRLWPLDRVLGNSDM